MTTRTRKSFSYYLADVYDSFGMSQTKIITHHDLKIHRQSGRKVVVSAASDDYGYLSKVLYGDSLDRRHG